MENIKSRAGATARTSISEAVILAGGLGTRLKPILPDLPKALAPIQGQPFIELLLESLDSKGFRRAILALGYGAEQVIERLGNRFSTMELVHEVEATPLGTGGALRRALKRCGQKQAFVFNGDTFLDLEVAAVEALWRKRGTPVVAAREIANTARYGRLEVREGRILEFAARGASQSGLINAGCYLLPTDILDDFRRHGAFSLEADFFPQAVREREFLAFVSKGRFIDIGTPESYARAQTELAG